MAGGIQEARVSHPSLVLCPSRHGAVGAHPQCRHWQHVQKWGSSVCFHHSPFICGLLRVFDSFFLPCNEWEFSDVPLGAASFLAVVNSAFVQTSAYSVPIEQLHVCRFWNLELWSEWCNCEGEAKGTTTKETSLVFVMELWWIFLISNFDRIKCLLNSMCVRLVHANAEPCYFSP